MNNVYVNVANNVITRNDKDHIIQDFRQKFIELNQYFKEKFATYEDSTAKTEAQCNDLAEKQKYLQDKFEQQADALKYMKK